MDYDTLTIDQYDSLTIDQYDGLPLDAPAQSLSATASLTAGLTGTIALTATGFSLTSNVGDYALSAGTVLGVVVASGGGSAVLSVTAPGTAGTITVATQGVTSGALSVAPVAVTALTVTSPTYAGTLSWTASAGATGYDVAKNGTVVSSAQAGTTYAFTGAVAGDVFTVTAKYNSTAGGVRTYAVEGGGTLATSSSAVNLSGVTGNTVTGTFVLSLKSN